MTKNNRLVRVAVDAMGGDHAPGEVIAGAIEAARCDDVQIMMVGNPDEVRLELSRHDTHNLPVIAIPSEGVILEDDQPALALRQKPRASILVATSMVKENKADASVTMGSTGAAMAAGVVILGVSEGIDRPAIGGPIIGLAPQTVIIDLGTSVDCRPSQLLSFAVIGVVLARQYWGSDRPRVGLLSVGSEAGKGNKQVRETTMLLAKSGLNFIGNVEANDLLGNRVDVAVCDGFVGNVVMKLTEGLGSAMADNLRNRLHEKLPGADLDVLVREVYEINNVFEAYGGAPILGLKGVSIVGHGRGNAKSVRQAIATAKHTVESELVPNVNKELARMTQASND